MEIFNIKKDSEIVGKITCDLYRETDFYIWEYTQNDINTSIKIHAKFDSNLYLYYLDYELLSKDLKVKKKLQCAFKNGLWKYDIDGEEIITKKRFYIYEMMLFLPLPKDNNEICLLDIINLEYSPIDYIQYPQKTVINVPEQYIIKYDNDKISSIKSLIYELEIIKLT